MIDRELLELAAKACWISLITIETKNVEFRGDIRFHGFLTHTEQRGWWNPLTDDGDALRLAVKLQIKSGYSSSMPPELALPRECGFAVTPSGQWFAIENPKDPYAATRRAIVRAAAEIGKMKGGKGCHIQLCA